MNTRQRKGLGKYDAPLKIQHQRGINDFIRGKIVNPFNSNTMQHREWERGFNYAYAHNLKKVQKHEHNRARG
jgi:hypothetical protein